MAMDQEKVTIFKSGEAEQLKHYPDNCVNRF